MANPEHIKWLLEGVEAWNARREQNPFRPDLEGADISKEFREAKNIYNYSEYISPNWNRSFLCKYERC